MPTIVGMTTTIRLRGAADIITVLPYHLGYRPADSLVVVCLTGNRIGMVGRIDLPPPDVDPALVTVELLKAGVPMEQPNESVLEHLIAADRIVLAGLSAYDQATSNA